jgi:hypothetical protein
VCEVAYEDAVKSVWVSFPYISEKFNDQIRCYCAERSDNVSKVCTELVGLCEGESRLELMCFRNTNPSYRGLKNH